MRASERMAAVQSPIIPVVAELLRKNPGAISLGQGVVFYGPPPAVFDAIRQFQARPENHKYQPVQGIPALVEALREKLRKENRIETEAGSYLLVTAGGNMGFMNAALAIADSGDEVILPQPFYFNHEMALAMAGVKPVLARTDSEHQLDLDAIRDAVTPRTRAIVTVSPNNPSGAVYPEESLRAINELCRERRLFHISDEAYEYFTFGQTRHFSPGSAPGADEHTISLFSLSKAFGFASWRIGYMVFPEALTTAIKKIQDTILICPPVISQYAALAAVQAGRAYCQPHLETMRRVRETVWRELKRIEPLGRAPESQGAFYFLVRLDADLDPLGLVEKLIEKYKVAAIPGTAFGLTDGCYLRVAYGALDLATATEGIRRLTTGLRELLSR